MRLLQKVRTASGLDSRSSRARRGPTSSVRPAPAASTRGREALVRSIVWRFLKADRRSREKAQVHLAAGVLGDQVHEGLDGVANFQAC